MDKSASITRRRLLVGAAIASVVAAVPAVANAGKTPSAVLEAIAAHKRAMRHLRQCGRTVDRLDALRNYQTERVHVGNLVTGFDRDGNRTTTPIYAYGHAQIDEHYAAHINSNIALKWPTARAEARRDAAHQELRRLERANKRAANRVGLTAAISAQSAAYAAENVAAVALILAQPATEAEAKAKKAYMGGRAFGRQTGREWWATEDRIDLIFANAFRVA